jgi:hypothetical protein
MPWQLLVRQNNQLFEGDGVFREWSERASAQEIADGLSDVGALGEHGRLSSLVEEELRGDMPVPARDHIPEAGPPTAIPGTRTAP